MAKLILKSIAYYPQALAELPMSHKDLGLIDTDKPYKKLIIPTQKQHLYRLVDMQTGQVLKAQKLIRDHNDLKVYVGDVIVVELKDFFSFDNVAMVKAEQEPLYLVDAGEVTCISGLISPADGAQLPEIYVLWEPGLPVQTCLNPNAMGLVPVAGLAGISGLTTGGALAMTATVGASIVQANLPQSTPPVVLPKLTGAVFAGPVIGQTSGNVTVSGLKVQAFDANGNSLGVTDVKADGTYELELTDAKYKGALVLKVFDPADDSVTAKYMNEATRSAKSFPTLMAVINYQGDATKPVTVNITALTNLAATKAGATVSGDSASVPAIDAIEKANTLVANKFLGNNSLPDSPVITTVNADGSSNLNNANSYGIALELLSQIENVSSKTTPQVADSLSPALSAPETNKTIISYLNQAAVSAIQSGVDASKVKAMVNAVGNQLATGTVSLSSNASPAIDLGTSAPDENSKLTASVSNFIDANNSNKADKTFSNPASFQWQSSKDGVNWSNIIGDSAKVSYFTLTQAEVGQQVRVWVKNTDDSGFDEYLVSTATKAVHNVNQQPAGSISIGVNNSGTLQQNNLLGIISNSLSDTDGLGSLSYQWQSRSSGGNFVDIAGATFGTYTLTQAEVGKEIRLKASYTDGQGTAEAVFSVQTGSVANVNDPPLGNVLVNGQNTPHIAYTQGDVLTATHTLSDPDNNGVAISGLTYQWQSSSDGSNWTDIRNATTDTYTLTQAEVGKHVQVLAKYTDATGVIESKASESSDAIVNRNDAPTGSLTVNGNATENQTLTATHTLTDADNNGAAISVMTYQWEQADTATGPWQAIASANGTTFTPGNEQVGKYLRVTVSYADAGGYNNSQSSAATAAITNVNDAHQGSVTVSGDNNATADYTQYAVLKAAHTLSDPDNNGTPISSVSYQWQNSADGIAWSNISGAITDSYSLTQSDVGKYVHVRATYTDLHGTTETVDSSTATQVANVNDPPTGSVTVSGSMTQGIVLQADNTLDDIDGMGTVSYQWQVSGNNRDWTDITGATNSSFTLTQAQTGQYVRVKASYTDGFNNTETLANDTSSNTTVVDVMEPPVLTLTSASKTFKEQTGAAQQANAVSGLFTNVSLSDAENNNITSITLSVSGLQDGANENLVVAGSNLSLVTAAAGTVLNGGVTYSSNINGSVATVTLTQTGGWTLAEAQTLIAGIGYQNTDTDNPTAGDRTVSLLQLVDNGRISISSDKNTVDFSAANSNAITATVTVQGVNDAPVLSGSNSPAYTENGPAFNVNPNISVSDVDSAKLVSAKVSISSGYVSGDALSLNAAGADTGNISASAFDTGTRTLTLTSASGATQAQWQNALRAVQFSSGSDTPGTSRGIDFVVNDGSLDSPTLTTTVSVTEVNDKPVLSTASNALAYTENSNSVIQPGITVSDADHAAPVKVTVAFINNSFVSAEDQLLFTSSSSTGNIAAAWNSGAGTLTLTSAGNTATLSQWNAAMQAVSYKNLSDTPNTSDRSIRFTANDGTDDSVAVVTTVNVTAINDAPVLAATSKNAAYTEPSGVAGASPVTVFGANSLNLTDAENNSIKAFSLNISGVIDSTEVLNVDGTDIALIAATTATTSRNGFTYSVASTDSQTFTVSFSKSTNYVDINTVKSLLEAMTYNNTNANNPTAGDRVVSVASVQDSGGGSTDTYSSSVASIAKSTVTVAATNDAPALAAVSINAAYTEPAGSGGASPVAVFGAGSLTLSDAESNTIKAFSLNITGVSDSTEVLKFDGTDIALNASTTGTTSGNGFTYSVTSAGPSSFTVALSKTSNFVAIGTVKSLLEAMTYNNTNANNPTSGPRVITVASVQDSGGGTDTYTSSPGNLTQSTVTVTATNDAPVNTVPGSTVSVGYNSSTFITGLGVSDADAGAATNFSVKLSVTQGTLTLVSNAGVTVTNNGTSSVTMTDKVANIHSLLTTSNAVKYTAPPNVGGSYTLTMTSNDNGSSGTGAGVDVVNTVSIAVNQPPVLGGAATVQTYTENGTAVPVFNSITVSDADNPTLASAKVSVTNYVAGQDVLGFTNTGIANMGNITGSFDAATGVMTLTSSGSSATQAQWQAALRAVTYSNTSENPNITPRTVSFTINDGAADSSAVSNTLNVIAVNDAPVASGSASLAAVNEDAPTPSGATVSSLFTSTFSDVDAGNTLAGVAITANAAAAAQGKWQWLNASTWTDIPTASLTDASALYLAAGTSLRFLPTANYNGTPGALTARLVDSSASGLSNGNTINVSTNGGTSAYSSATVSLGTSITAVNDAPVLTLTANNLTFTEGSGSSIGNVVTGIFTSAAFTDLENNNIASITLTISNVLDGSNEVLLVDGQTIALGSAVATTALNSTNGLSYSQTWDSANKLSTIVLSKAGGVTLGNANAIVQSIGYRNNNADNPSAGTRILSVTQITDVGASTSPDINTSNYTLLKANLLVTPVNDAPSFTNSPAVAAIATGGSTNFSLPNTYSLADPDAGTGNMQLSLTLKEGVNATGTLAYAFGSSGVTFISSTGNVYIFKGTLTQLNTWLSTSNYLTYQPTNGFVGPATVAMNINDMGNTGGAALNANATNPLSLTVTDATPPALRSQVTSMDGSTITLTFDEALTTTAGATAPAGSFTYKIGASSSYTPTISTSGNQVVLTLPTKPVYGDNVTVSYTAPTLNNAINNAALQDITGNDAVSFTNSTVTNNVLNIAPTLTTTSVKNAILTSAFSVNGSSGNVTAVNINGSSVELTLAASVSLSAPITLTYTNADTNKCIQDAMGNDAAGISPAITVPAAGTYTQADTLAPTLISAVLNAARDKVILTYSESLYTATAPDKAKFTVTAGTDASTFNTQIINTAQVNPSNPNTVELQLSTPIANTSPFVTVSYSNTTDNTLANTTAVQDPTGNDASSYNRLLVPTTNTDNVAPVLRSATTSSVGGVNKLILNYSEPLNNLSNFTEASGLNAPVSAAVPVFSTAVVNPGESQNINALTFTVSGLADGANEKITVDGTAITLGAPSTGTTATNAMGYTVTLSGTTATVSLSKPGGITTTQAQNLITGISYQNTNADNPTPGVRTFDITSLTDSSGAANATSTFVAGTNSSSVLVSATNDSPVFSTNTAPVGMTITNSQAPSKALSINTRGYVLSDPDAGNSIEALAFGLADITSPAAANGTNTLAPLNFNFPNRPTSLYLSRTSDYTYTVSGTVSDLNDWLQLSNSITYNPRSTYVGTTYSANFKIIDTFGGFMYSNGFTVAVTADTTAPVLIKAVLSSEASNKIILSYDEPLNSTAGNIPLASQFTVTGTTVSNVSVVGSNVILTTAANVAAGVIVGYTNPAGTAAIQDAASNHAVTSSSTLTADTVAPVLDSSPVFYNGSSGMNKYILYFNEEMASTTSNVTGFNVTVVDPVYPDRTGTVSLNAYQSGGSTSFTEKAFVLNLNCSFLSTSASIQIKYVDPTSGNDLTALQDLAGNDAPNMVLGAWTNDNLSAVDANFVAGKNVLVVGGLGNDTMTGGAANDTFTWFAGDAGATGAVDVVKSFVPIASGVGDKLDILKLLSGYNSGTSTLSQWVTSITTAQTSPAGVAGSTKIVIDTDGLGLTGAIQTIWLEGVNLSSTDPAVLKASGVLIA